MSTQFDLFNKCVFKRDAEGKLVITWHNGQSMNAVTGASIQYIDVHMRMSGMMNTRGYEYTPSVDVHRMVTGGLDAKLAVIVAAMRRTVLAMKSATVNLTECWIIEPADVNADINQEDFTKLRDNASAFAGIVQQSITILAMNGLSMLNKGHNYLTYDKAWGRLVQATGLDDHFEKLGITDWEGTIFHDALHPFDLAWKARLVISKDTPLNGHIHGVAMVRMPGVPAGTAIVGVTITAIEDIIAIRPAAEAQLGPFRKVLLSIQRRVKNEPLNWCTHIGGSGTAKNLANIKLVEGNCAFVGGVAKHLFDKKATILQSKSLNNVIARMPARVKLGVTYAEMLPESDLTNENVSSLLGAANEQALAYVDGLEAITEDSFVFSRGNVDNGDEIPDDEGSESSEAGTQEAGAPGDEAFSEHEDDI
jgi:hypothetical protein